MRCLLFAALAACAADGGPEERDPVPEVGISKEFYPLMHPSLLPLAPVNSVTKRVFVNPCVIKFDGRGLDPNELQKQDGRSVSMLSYARSRSAVDDALEIKVAASFSSPFAAAAAELEASRAAAIRGEALYLVGELFAYTNHVVNAGCKLVLTDEATRLLSDDTGLDAVPEAERARYRAARFMRVCGDGWVHSRRMGGGGTLILEWKATSTEAKTALRAELEGRFGSPLVGGTLGGRVKSMQTKLAQSVALKTTLVTHGSIGGIAMAAAEIETDVAKLDGVIQRLEMVASTLSSADDIANLTPMGAFLGAYNGMEPSGGWLSIKDEGKANRILEAQAQIKPLSTEMGAYLTPRANLIKELEYDLAQIQTITSTDPMWFNYSGGQRSYQTGQVLQKHRSAPDYADLAHYKASFIALKARLQREMSDCEESGANGFVVCKTPTPLPEVVAAEIRKWRENRPLRLAVWNAGLRSSSGWARVACDDAKGIPVAKDEAPFVTPWAIASLPPSQGWTGRPFWLRDSTSGERCPGGGVAHSMVWEPVEGRKWDICGSSYQIPALCRGAASLWDLGYWKDELAL
jgi:hypothetical protein